MDELQDIEFLKTDKKLTSNYQLIHSAFLYGFKQGVAFLNESDSRRADDWRRKAFKEFCEKHKIKH